jgi:Secretion system C-terminal sorting domain/Reeler domain
MRHVMLTLLILLMTTSLGFAFSSGPPDGMAGDPPAMNNCTQCHTSFPVNSGEGTLNVITLTTYEPGEVYSVAVELTDPDAQRWGFELIAMDADNNAAGTIELLQPARTQLSGNYIKHTSAGTDPGTTGSDQWSFNWFAPEVGTGDVTFYVAGNAANNADGNQGDRIYTNTFVMTEFVNDVAERSAVAPTEWQLANVYPNPFNGQVNIQLDAASLANTTVGIYDILGRLVTTLHQGDLNPGQYVLTWAPQGSAGVYFLRATNNQGWVQTQKLQYLK